MKIRVKQEDGRYWIDASDYRNLNLEIILIMAGKYKNASLKLGLAVNVFIVDSIIKTAQENEEEEVHVSRKMIKKYINQAIRKNKRKVDKELELILDHELEEITAHEIDVVSEGIKNSEEVIGLKELLTKVITNQNTIIYKIGEIAQDESSEDEVDAVEDDEEDPGEIEKEEAEKDEIPATKKRGRPPKNKD